MFFFFFFFFVGEEEFDVLDPIKPKGRDGRRGEDVRHVELEMTKHFLEPLADERIFKINRVSNASSFC